MIWCPTDRRYFCMRCYNQLCKPAHGSKPATAKQVRLLGIALLVVFGSGLAPIAGGMILIPPYPGVSWNDPAAGTGILLLILAGVAWLGLTSLVRRILHGRAVQGQPPLPPEAMTDMQDPNLDWRPNRAAPPRRLQLLASVMVGAAVVDAVLVVLVAPGLSPAGLAQIMVGVTIATLLGATAALLAAFPFAVPSAIAVAGDGIHFWYDSPVDRRTTRDVLPWKDLNILAMSAPGTTDPTVRLARYLRIDKENAKAIADAWPRHRVDRSGSAFGSPPPLGTAPYVADTGAPRRSSAVVSGTVSPSQRGAACARCRVRFPGLEGLRLIWCKEDRFYVCRACWHDGCHEGHGKGKRAMSKPAGIVAGVVILAAFLALWYPAAAYDSTLTNAWQDAPVGTVGGIQAGQVVKLAGWIQAPGTVAWGGHEIYSSSGWYWYYNSTDTFKLLDFTGTVAVTTAAYYIVYYGLHASPYATHTTMWVYETGDWVQLVGTVVRQADGSLAVEAQIVAPLGYAPEISIPPSPWDAPALIGIPAILAGLGIGTAAVLAYRRRRTRAALNGQPLLAPDGAGDVRDPGLDWQPNGKGTSPRRRGITGAVIVLASAGILALFPGFGPRANAGYFLLGLIGSIAVAFAGMVVYLLLFGGVGKPTSVAVADDGFHIWFDSPYDRHLNDTLFPWDEIRDIHMTGGKGAHWVLRWTDGEVTNLYMLTGHNLNLLIGAWTERKTPTG